MPTGSVYGASIPIELARRLKRDIILAYEMNGEPITRDHGYPVRIILPGIVGARQVKWLNKITLSNKESDCHWQQRDYKGFHASIDWDNVDFSTVPAIQELPVQSAICEPLNGSDLEEGTSKYKLDIELILKYLLPKKVNNYNVELILLLLPTVHGILTLSVFNKHLQLQTKMF